MRVLTCFLVLVAGTAWADDLLIDQRGFTAVHANEDVRVNIRIGPAYSVIARTLDGSDISRLSVDRYDGWLVFRRDARWLMFPNWRRDVFEVTVTTPVLNEVKAFDGADVRVTGGTGKALRAEARGGGQIVLDDIDYTALTLTAEQGQVLAQGPCEQFPAIDSAAARADVRVVEAGSAGADSAQADNTEAGDTLKCVLEVRSDGARTVWRSVAVQADG